MVRNIQFKASAKPIIILVSAMGILVSTGCTHTVSENISKDGHVATSDLVFPNPEKAWRHDGTFPNQENLSKIHSGITKDDLYQLIGPPHFSEGQHAQEWDYIFKFLQDDGSIKFCQYKVIFDQNYQGQEFYWQPSECGKYAQKQGQSIQVHPTSAAIVASPAVTPIINEKINLSADTLFQFDKWRASDMTQQGRQSLDNLAAKLRHYQTQGDSRIVITGYTDRLGDDIYNLNLSQLRAQTVREYLIAQGVEPASMIAAGAGEASPVKICANTLNRQALIDCLQPNRRVEVAVTVYTPQN